MVKTPLIFWDRDPDQHQNRMICWEWDSPIDNFVSYQQNSLNWSRPTVPPKFNQLCMIFDLTSTRSSADADNRLDAFSGQSRSTNMVPFHMLHIVSYCAIVTLSLRRAVFTIFVFKKFHDLEMGVKGHSRSLRVVSFDRLCMVSY